ncbi:MAG: hypothetical protein M3Q65_24910, partial [Chloroflexota bacterium]|nr:hypothetical protein [Chloroflexota bacterium]
MARGSPPVVASDLVLLGGLGEGGDPSGGHQPGDVPFCGAHATGGDRRRPHGADGVRRQGFHQRDPVRYT